MKFTILSSSLPLLAAALPANPTTQVPNPNFSVMAIRSASPIHYLQMNAVGQKFYLGGKTASYCPTQVPNCPPGNQTVFTPNGASLDVEVPGGQQVYVDPQGALSFTQAHSMNIPPGSAQGPFVYSPDQPWAHYSFTGWGASGYMACPVDDGRWQVFAAVANATVPKGDVKECLGFSAMALGYEGDVPAWQYI